MRKCLKIAFSYQHVQMDTGCKTLIEKRAQITVLKSYLATIAIALRFLILFDNTQCSPTKGNSKFSSPQIENLICQRLSGKYNCSSLTVKKYDAACANNFHSILVACECIAAAIWIEKSHSSWQQNSGEVQSTTSIAPHWKIQSEKLCLPAAA